MKARISLAALLMGAAAASWSPLRASSTLEGLPLDRLVINAERICEVEILERRCVMRENGGIETRYLVSTLLPLKGAQPSVQEICMPGGEVADRGLIVPGMPDLQIGERHLLFLSAESVETGWRIPVGLESGCFRVDSDKGKGRVVIRPAMPQDGRGAEAISYDSFLARVQHEIWRS